ncbi:MAG: uracil-DNA glycosylase [Candidatus Thermoplasmatota archaeon]|nr:uracil-DNA glycosylase [Candidatus Thermoplasmatota archaeon]MCL5731259.1 uracil-DNA glycosylase [Candidatus Thermoplasmatota archaeon]
MPQLDDLCSLIASCKMCGLHYFRKNAVCGKGPANAKYMIIGEAPGFQEDEVGAPFIGRSGKLIDSILSELGISRDSIYITNAVRCRPSMNKTPSVKEIKTCSDYLKEEISIVAPRVIIPMGNVALKSLGYVFGKKFPKVSEITGKVILVNRYYVYPQFHPAAILRNPKKNVYFSEGLKMVFTSDSEKLLAEGSVISL